MPSSSAPWSLVPWCSPVSRQHSVNEPTRAASPRFRSASEEKGSVGDLAEAAVVLAARPTRGLWVARYRGDDRRQHLGRVEISIERHREAESDLGFTLDDGCGAESLQVFDMKVELANLL